MTKLKALAFALLVGGIFVAGVAVGKETKTAKFITRDEVKFEDMQGPKLGQLTGDVKKGPYVALLTLPAGFESPWHTHGGDYEAVMVSGTSRHWVRGEDGTKAKRLTAGSYWMMPGKTDHISACDKGADCLVVIWQKSKFDFAMAKDPAAPKEAPKK